MTIRRRITIAFTIIFTVFFGFGFIAQSVMRRVERHIEAHEHIEHVQNHVNEIDIAKLQYVMEQDRVYIRNIYVLIDNIEYELTYLEQFAVPARDNPVLEDIKVLLQQYEEQVQWVVTISDQHDALREAVYVHWTTAMREYQALSASEHPIVHESYQDMQTLLEELQVVGLNAERLSLDTDQALESVHEMKRLADRIADLSTLSNHSRIQGRRMERALTQYIAAYEKKGEKLEDLLQAGELLDQTTARIREHVRNLLRIWHVNVIDENQALQQVLQISLILAAIIMFVTTSVTRTYMLRKINNLEHAVESIGKGNYKVELDESDATEFGHIAKGINAMARSMDESINRMWAINRSLEDTVNARTRAIQKVNRQLEEANAALEEERQWLKVEAGLDSITELENRRAIFVALSELASLKEEADHPYAVALIELDHYMDYVREKGHAFGEQMLIAAAGVIREGLRESDRAGRLAAEQFVVIFRNCELEEANDRLYEMLQQFQRESEKVFGVELTFSAGIANEPAHEKGMWLSSAERNLKVGRVSGRHISFSQDQK